MADAAPQDKKPEALEREADRLEEKGLDGAAEEKREEAAAAEEEQKPLELEVPAFATMDEAMAWVWGEVRRVPKSGTHPKQGWKFATESDIADLIRDLCAHAGITIHQTLLKHREEIIGTTSNGNPIWRHTVIVRYQLRWNDLVWPSTKWKGQADDSSDKGLAKAFTACRKTYLIATFQVSSGDDPDRAETPEVEPGSLTRPRGSKAPAGEYRSPTAKADPKTEGQLQEAARLRVALTAEMTKRGAEDADERLQQFLNSRAAEIGVAIREMNRAEFEVLLDTLRNQAKKMLPGFDSRTGEVTTETPSDGSTGSDDPEVAPPADAGEAPAEPAQPVDPAPVPDDVQQAIEKAAAEVRGDELPAPKSGDVYREALQVAERGGIEDTRLLEIMLAAGAARPSDLDADPVKSAFLDALNAEIELTAKEVADA